MERKRNAPFGFKAWRVFSVKNLVTLVAELFEPRGNRGDDVRKILLEIFHVRFQVGFLVVGADQSERVLPGGQDVRAAIFVFLENLYDHRGAARLGNALPPRAHATAWVVR